MVFVALSVTYAKAQTSLIATLNHEGTLSTFYGSTALQQAHEAATDGDVITLSSGTFASVDITKAITLRGAGMFLDAETQTEPTVLANAFNIRISDETTQKLTIEGVYSNQTITINKLNNATFIKNRFANIYVKNGYGRNLTFIHCRNTGSVRDDTNDFSASFQNCIIASVYGQYFTFKNCIFADNNLTYLYNNSEYRNCIILKPAFNGDCSSSTFYNNLYTDDSSKFYITKSNNTNIKIATNDNRIKNLLNYYDDNDYKLTEEAKAIMKGTDGTEVGIYGGNLPYDPTPTNPQITKFNVASKTTADGKLSVDIEVKSAE